MSFDPDTFWSLLPAVHRIRDAEFAGSLPLLTTAEEAELAALIATRQASGLDADQAARLAALTAKTQAGPLRSLLDLIATQVGALEADLDQLYDDQFIETCADWVVPYIGALVGWRPATGGDRDLATARADVANTIALRRRKGAATMLAQTARDLTGLDAAAVEYFRRLMVSQSMLHIRADVTTPRPDAASAALVGGAFDTIPRSADVRSIARGRGRYNIPNVGLFLWRARSAPMQGSPAVRVDDRRFLFSPIGIDQPLWADPASLAENQAMTADDVAGPLSLRRFAAAPADHYGEGQAIRVTVDGTAVPIEQIQPCCLADLGPDPATSDWAAGPDAMVLIDSERGRLMLPAGTAAGATVLVDFHFGAEGAIGGGSYDRSASLETSASATIVPTEQPDLAAALTAPGFAGGGVIEIVGDRRDAGAVVPPSITAAAGQLLAIQAANGDFPTFLPDAPIILGGGAGAEIILDGFRFDGQPLTIPAQVGGEDNGLQLVRLRNCTLVPGGPLDRTGAPTQPGTPALVIESPTVQVEIEASILGPIHAVPDARVRISGSVLDAGSAGAAAYAAADGSAGGALWMFNTTVFGSIATQTMALCSNCIVLGAVVASRTQSGIVRFSYTGPGSVLPRRYRCLPAEGTADVPPTFLALRYGAPDYARLAPGCDGPSHGADDEGQIGAFHDLDEGGREAALITRLAESLPIGLEAGIFYADQSSPGRGG